jgi:hypothetical protein
VRQTALEFLPEALQHFLKLPPAFANVHPLKDGKTAKTLLLEQLDLLATTMEQWLKMPTVTMPRSCLCMDAFSKSVFVKWMPCRCSQERDCS